MSDESLMLLKLLEAEKREAFIEAIGLDLLLKSEDMEDCISSLINILKQREEKITFINAMFKIGISRTQFFFHLISNLSEIMKILCENIEKKEVNEVLAFQIYNCMQKNKFLLKEKNEILKKIKSPILAELKNNFDKDKEIHDFKIEKKELICSKTPDFVIPINVLVVFANPKGSNPLRLSTEHKVIIDSIKRSSYRKNIKLQIIHAATIHDVRHELLEQEFKILHFSGHGTGQGLAFEDEVGEINVVPPKALSEFLNEYCPPIECVLLNACYSNKQGKLISVKVPYNIVIEGPISDSGATEFTRGFYDAIGANKGFEFAYREGCHTMKLTGHKESECPILLKKSLK